MKRLFALLLLAAMLFTLFACGNKTADASTQTDHAVANVLPTEGVSSIAYSDGSTTSRFVNREDKWYWQDDESFPLDGAYLEDLTAILMDMGDNPPLGVTSDPSAYGLADTVRYITVSDAEGSLTLLLGATAPEGGRYMAVEGDTSGSVYLAPVELLEAMARPVYAMALLPSLPKIDGATMVSARLARGDVSYYAHKVNDVWKAGGKEIPGNLENLWATLDGWQLSRCVDYKPSQGVYELCGLADPLVVELMYTDSVGNSANFAFSVGNACGADNSEYYVLLGADTTVYAMSATTLAEVMTMARRAMLYR